jgi:ribosomal protein S6--L-glutamate ligase
MRIAILSGGDGWHVRDLQRAAAALGHEAVAVDFRRLSAGVSLPLAGRELPSLAGAAGWDGVMVRTMPPGSLEQVVFRMDLLQRLQARGVPVLNPARPLEVCVDKYLATACLESAGLRVPATVACQHADAALEAFAALGGDVVVKPLFGSEGRGMLRLSDPELAWRTFRTLERTQCVLYLQEYIHHPGWDLRVLVLAGRVLAAMRRRSRGDWRTNVAQGGVGEVVELGKDQIELALKAAAAVGAVAAGVDLLPGPDGEWYVLEVNAVPGWRALAPVTGVDVAAALVRCLASGACVP